MSLLLDALKKAEQEKQKALDAEESAAKDDTQPSEQEAASGAPSDQQQPDQFETVSKDDAQVKEIEDELELVIDGPAVKQEELEQDDLDSDVLEVPEPALAPPLELEKSTATTSTVSDEALQLLVHKTNKKYHHRQRVVWGSLLSVAIIILVVAGAYHYYGVLEEVNALERKHKMAMRVVHEDPVKQRKATVDAGTTDRVATIQSSQNTSELKRAVEKKPVNSAAVHSSEATEVKRNFSIEKTKTLDPINTLLQAAWLAYNKSDYSTASRAYEKVLRREPKNRDALLGMAAVAVKNADYKKAKASYGLLLKLDPRDQVAVSAMSNLDELSSNSQNESKLKFMLQRQPSATHLNFALGNYYAGKGKWPEAQAEYFKAWQGNSNNADYIYNLAVSLDQLGKSNEALRFYKESLSFGSQQNVSFSISVVEKRIEKISAK